MTDFSLNTYRLELIHNLQQQMQTLIQSDTMPELQQNPLPDKLAELISRIERSDDSALFETQQLISNVIGNFPQLTPLISRDLLWLLGGDCLHWMPEDEVTLYQKLDELYFDSLQNNEPFDWIANRKLLGITAPNSH